MKEKEFINIIKNTLNSELIGDDCAYLKDLGIVVTQDSLVEDVHFSRKFSSPYQLGYKSAMVNISDVCASGAKPLYLTVSLSLPDDIDGEFIKEFYKGMSGACNGVEIAGGDITGSDKIYISVTAIGSDAGRKISSRKNAKVGQKIIVSGEHGASGAGLKLLFEGRNEPEKFIKAHLMPEAQLSFSEEIALQQKTDYAMMDTSDGLMDALSQIAIASGVVMEVDFEKIPFDTDLKQFKNFEDIILYGAEDYQLIATVDDAQNYTVIGDVKSSDVCGVKINYSDKSVFYTKEDVERKLYKHFKE
ncbi:MAG: thiamine-phosphate kinase [Brachyspira sp.]|mgnify:FL=1|jgi:thiamine-phosphate kinase|nr:thiamine-phosphate kinase [Brachyspira sp.]